MLKLQESRPLGRRPEQGGRIWWAPLALAVILLVGGGLRFTNLDWDDFKWIHPDESHMQSVLSKIHTPEDLSLYFDTHRSPLNVRNSGDRYSYGTLPLFAVRVMAEGLDGVCASMAGVLEGQTVPAEGAEPPGSPLRETYDLVCRAGSFTGVRNKLVGRILSGLADLGTILLAFFIARRLYGEAAGLLAAGLTALTAFLIQQAHFFTVDSALCFFVTLTAYFAVRASQTGGWASFALAGLSAGLAAACKVSAAPAALLAVLAAVAWIWSLPASQRGWWGLGNALARLAIAGALCLIAFRVAQPYAFEGPGFFGVELSPEWEDRLGQIQNEQSGNVDSPPDQQWANRAPLLFPWLNMVVWGMGLPLGLTAWAGWALAGLELWRRRRVRTHLVLWGWTGLMFLYLGTRWVKSMRYFISLYPLLVVLAAYALIRLCRVTSRRWRYTGFALTAVVVAGTALWGCAVFSIYLRDHTRLAAGQWIYDNVPEGSVLATEHWDWGPHIPGGKTYRGLHSSPSGEMEHYHEDTWEKYAQLYAWIEEADYIVISSNRIYAVVPRLKGRYAVEAEDYRYPLTTEYYRALFAGELGFELVADFTSRPSLFGLVQFPDQETPFPLTGAAEDVYVYQTEPVKVFLPPAEEAFSVYDHPRVLIFRKTDGYSREGVEEVLGGIDVSRALHHVKPVEFSAAPDLMEFDPETWADQQAGGTWSEMFDRHGLLNRYPGLAAVVWWIVVVLLGWLAFPLLFVALPRLRDRGYGLARILGLLLLAYLTWLLASLRVLPNTRGAIVFLLLVLALAGGGVGWLRRDALRQFVRRNRRLILVTEGVFALLYLMWIGIRFLQPDLWHPIVGGEKPMDFAYFNAVMKSTWFPPYNPWFSGGYTNYYYFGFVIVGTLTKLVGTVPAIAYNLIVPLLCAMTGVGAFSVAYNLFGGHRRGALLAGVMALVFVVVLGNLGVVKLIRDALVEVGGGPSFDSTIPGYPETVAMFEGLWEVIAHGTSLPLRNESWYWNPTRIIPADTGNPIAEFPAFTFLYADLHAHMIAFPLTLLALALVLYWVRAPRPHWGSLLIGGVVIGALRPTNTWDYYTYLMLGLVALALGAWAGWRSERLRQGEAGRQGVPGGEWALWPRIKSLVLRIGWLVGLTVVLYLPYIQHYAGYSEVEVWEGGHTPAGIYLWIHGILLFPLLIRLLVEVGRVFAGRVTRSGFEARPWRLVLGLWMGLLFLVLALIVLPAIVLLLWKAITGVLVVPLFLQVLLVVLPVVALVGTLFLILSFVSRALTDRRPLEGAMGLSVLLLSPFAAVGLELALLGVLERMEAVVVPAVLWDAYEVLPVLFVTLPLVVPAALLFLMPRMPISRRMLWLMIGLAMAISIGVEVIVVKGDIGRQNTVFKFYLQVWILLSIAAGVAVAWIRERARRWSMGLRYLWWGGMGLLVLGGALFLPFGVRARAIDRMAGEKAELTLDGMAFMEHSTIYGGPQDQGREIALYGDYHAILWMQDHIQGSPVILEALGWREYLWANRVSIYTGLPSVVGWRWHQVQQRLMLPAKMVDLRRDDVRACYNTTDPSLALSILAHYNVRYIYVGDYERAYYSPVGLAKFDDMAEAGLLRVVYPETHGVTIYEVVTYTPEGVR